jgi:two-component system, OmpR family, sensor histidine kinase TctE
VESDISVELTVEAPWVTLSICDQGLGFPKTGAKRLTERFARGDNVAGIVGSGLGLTIVDEVIQAHSGNLIISNNLNGVGACVSISFPSS